MTKNLFLAGVLALCGTIALASTPAHAGNGLTALGLLPDDTMLVMSADVTRLKKSQLAKDLFGAVASDGEFAELEKRLRTEAKLDIHRDVDTLVIGVRGEVSDADKVVFIAEGRFDQAGVITALKKDAKVIGTKTHRGMTYRVIDGDTEFAFIGKYFVVTPKGGMTAVIDVQRGKAPSVAKSTAFKSLLAGSHAKRGAWFGLVMTDDMRKEIASETGGHSVSAVIAGVDVTKDVQVDLLMRASDKEAAASMAKAFAEGVREAAKEPSLQLFGMTEVLNKMVISANGSDVSVTLTIPGVRLQQLLPLLKSAL